MVHGKQLTVIWHVDDLKISHVSKNVITRMITWLDCTYVRLFNEGAGAMKSARGKCHIYLGMHLDFTTKGEVKISMIPYITEIVQL